MHLNVSSNIKDAERYLTSIQKKQIPFAAKGALDATAFDVQRAEKKAMQEQIDRPTPFTLSGVRVSKATKQALTAEVFIEKKRLSFISKLVHGGESESINQPVNQKLNKYGNIPRGRIAKAAQDPRFFFGIPKGRTGDDLNGLWERTSKNTKIRQITRFKRTRVVKRQYHFYEVAQHETLKVFDKHLAQKLAFAFKTAK
jgi:hypothetical protein